MKNVLYLTASNEPLTMMALCDALRLVVQDKAEVVEADETRTIRSERSVVPLPLVVRLKRHVRVPRRMARSVSNTLLFARDGYRCQYCGRTQEQLSRREALNRDHIQPLSRGGANSWTNCVTACSRCNSAKANRTPAEAGMVLRSTPKAPSYVELRWTVRRLTAIQRKYITAFYGAKVAASLGWDRIE